VKGRVEIVFHSIQWDGLVGKELSQMDQQWSLRSFPQTAPEPRGWMSKPTIPRVSFENSFLLIAFFSVIHIKWKRGKSHLRTRPRNITTLYEADLPLRVHTVLLCQAEPLPRRLQPRVRIIYRPWSSTTLGLLINGRCHLRSLPPLLPLLSFQSRT